MLLASFIADAGKPFSGVEFPPSTATASLRPKLANVPEFTGANFSLMVPLKEAAILNPINSPICHAI